MLFILNKWRLIYIYIYKTVRIYCLVNKFLKCFALYIYFGGIKIMDYGGNLRYICFNLGL